MEKFPFKSFVRISVFCDENEMISNHCGKLYRMESSVFILLFLYYISLFHIFIFILKNMWFYAMTWLMPFLHIICLCSKPKVSYDSVFYDSILPFVHVRKRWRGNRVASFAYILLFCVPPKLSSAQICNNTTVSRSTFLISKSHYTLAEAVKL